MIRISIVEDHRATRENMLKLLRHAPELVCVGAYGNVEQAEREIPQDPPDVVLMDINLAGASGIGCVAKLKQSHPKIEFVMLTTYDDTELIFSALRSGASGYLLKRSAPDELIAAIKDVHGGGSPMSMEIARQVTGFFHKSELKSKSARSELEVLHAREYEVLEHLADGKHYREIGAALYISVDTVRSHIRHIYEKLQVHSRAEAAAKFFGR
jgi:DNA-binding NarL/FixJ family response regulator